MIAFLLTAQLTACGFAPASMSKYPDSIAALGHSGMTGYDSNPDLVGNDAPQNSWATGTNPAVDSIYLRLLKLHPAIRGHAVNVAVGGSDVTDLPRQVREALAARPLPQLFLFQGVNNDIRCDGTDGRNYKPFQQKMTAVLERIARGAPDAQILIVTSPWATTANVAQVAAQSDAGISAKLGDGPCDLFSLSGKLQPTHVSYYEHLVGQYHAALRAACGSVPNCHLDGGALHAMHVTAKDFTEDFAHLSVHGLAKEAALEWKVLSKLFWGSRAPMFHSS